MIYKEKYIIVCKLHLHNLLMKVFYPLYNVPHVMLKSTSNKILKMINKHTKSDKLTKQQRCIFHHLVYAQKTKYMRWISFNLARKQKSQNMLEKNLQYHDVAGDFDIPSEIVYIIFTFLDAFALTNVAQVSHSWNSLALRDKLWELKGQQDTLMTFIFSKKHYQAWLLQACPIVFEEVVRRWVLGYHICINDIHEQTWCCEKLGFTPPPCQQTNQWVKVSTVDAECHKLRLKNQWNKCVYRLKHHRSCKWLASVYKSYLQAHPHLVALNLPKQAQVAPFLFL